MSLRALRKPNLRRLRLRIDNRFALGVHKNGLCPDPQIPALNGFTGQFNKLLGLLRGIEQRRQLANRPPPGAFTFLRVPLVRFLASASATSRVIPNTANVLMASLQSGAALRDRWWHFGFGWGITGDRHGTWFRHQKSEKREKHGDV